MAQTKSAFYQQARYFTSAAKLSQLPNDEGREVAFVGRSNSGKSSSLNVVTQQKRLTHVSKMPGRTQLINVFTLDDSSRLIDLPGYGYAAVGEEKKILWHQLITDYLQKRNCLYGIIIVMDIRHPLKTLDWQLLEFTQSLEIPAHILLNKADKLSLSKAKTTLFLVRKQLKQAKRLSSVQLFSATMKLGLDELWQKLDEWFDRRCPPWKIVPLKR